MQILFLYLKRLNRIVDQGFNFGGEHLFEYIADKQQLNIKHNPFYIPGFFNTPSTIDNFSNVLNVTGIIAENGAGKTSLLNCIRENLATGKPGVSTPMIIVFEHNGEKKICHFDDLPISNNAFQEFGFTKKIISPNRRSVSSGKPNEPDFEYTTPQKIDEFYHTDFIYFSNVFGGHYDIAVKGIHDISTSYLLRQDLISDIENNRVSRDSYHSEINTHLSHDILRQIVFINAFKDKGLIPFDLPELLYIRTKRDFKEFLTSFDEGDIKIIEESGFSYILNYVISQASKQREECKDWKGKAEIFFVASCLINFLYELATDFRSIQTHIRFELGIGNFDNNVGFIEAAKKLVKDIEKTAESFEIAMTNSFYTRIHGVETFLDKIPDLIQEDLVSTSDGNAFALNIQNNSELFANFYDSYRDSYSLKPFLDFSWREMSSGETAFLNIFSRFYSLVDKGIRFNDDQLRRNLIILIDEGEVYLHPTWQKKFLQMILDFLPAIYEKQNGMNRNIQIIFTTNSPIPASDLPNSNIIFLEKLSDKVVVKNSLEDKKMTFGANINTLLGDSFFLKDGAIGDLARNKINHIIELLQDNYDIILKKKDYLEKAINFIGEPIIRHKLIQMLTDRLNLNLIGMNQRLAALEKEVSELRKKSNS